MSLRANYFNLRKRLQMRVSRQMPKLTQHSSYCDIQELRKYKDDRVLYSLSVSL